MEDLVEEKRYNFLIDVIRKNEYTIGAEVGCEKGNTTIRLLECFPRLQLYAVDLWGSQPEVLTEYCKATYKDWNFKTIKLEFYSQIKPHKQRVTILQGVSWEMAKLVEDQSLDFVFIDADHGYESVKKDIIAWTPKLKSKGMVSGHDINLQGVIQATSEMVQEGRLKYGEDKCWYCKKEDIKTRRL